MISCYFMRFQWVGRQGYTLYRNDGQGGVLRFTYEGDMDGTSMVELVIGGLVEGRQPLGEQEIVLFILQKLRLEPENTSNRLESPFPFPLCFAFRLVVAT